MSAERVAKKIQNQDSTVLLTSHERPAEELPTVVSKPPAAQESPAVASAPALVLLLGVAALLLPRTACPRGREPADRTDQPRSRRRTYKIALGEVSSVRIRRGRPLAAVVSGPSTIGVREADGVDVQGTITEARPAAGSIDRLVDAGAGAMPVFAPLVTNMTSECSRCDDQCGPGGRGRLQLLDTFRHHPSSRRLLAALPQ